MTSLIVVSFTNEAQAIQASHKLVKLESSGSITVYEKLIVKRILMGKPLLCKPTQQMACVRFQGWPLVHL